MSAEGGGGVGAPGTFVSAADQTAYTEGRAVRGPVRMIELGPGPSRCYGRQLGWISCTKPPVSTSRPAILRSPI